MMSSPTFVASQSEPRSERSTRNVLLFLLFGVLLCGFWLVDHTPFASDNFNPYGDINSENRTADRIQKVNLITAPARVLIALVGIGFLFLRPIEKVYNSGAIIITTLLFVGFLFASVTWSINPYITVHKCAVLACFGVAAYGLARQLKVEELVAIFACICIGYIFIGFVAEVLLGNFTPHKKDYRFVGTCHPNSLGVYGGFCCLVATVYFGYRPKLNPLLIFIFVIGFGTLLITKSRTALAGLMMGMAAVWFTKVNPNQRVFVISSSLLLLVALGIALALARSNVRAAVAEKMAMGRTKSVSTLTGRLPLWEELIDSIEERPLLGHGYLAYWDKDQIEYLKDVLRWEIPHGHNMYLDWALDGGLIGLGLFLLMLITALLVAFYRATVLLNRHAVFVFGFLMFTFVHGFAESLFKLPTYLAFVVVTLTLKMAITHPKENSDMDRDAEPNSTGPVIPVLNGAVQ